MSASTPSLPAGEDLLVETSRSFAKGLPLCVLLRDGFTLSTTDVVAIAHALGEAAITDRRGALASSLDSVYIDVAGRVGVRGVGLLSGPPVSIIKRELERLLPVAAHPLVLRRMLAFDCAGIEEYLDRLAELSDGPPNVALARLANRWLKDRQDAWAAEALAAPDARDMPAETPVSPGSGVLKFRRHNARHGDEFPSPWWVEPGPTWRARRPTPDEPSGGWSIGRTKRVLVFAGEEAPESPDASQDRVGRVPEPDQHSPLGAPSAPSADGRSGRRPWHSATALADGARRLVVRYVRAHVPSSASQLP